MSELIEVAHDKGLERMEGEVLSKNIGMLDLAESLGFKISPVAGDDGIKAVKKKL
jgi:acetyltransferase